MKAASEISLQLEVVMQEAILRHLLVLRAWFAIVGKGINADAATRNKDARHLDVLWCHQADEVLHDDVDAVLVETTVIAKREEIKLEALALHHLLVRQVAYPYLCKVWLACDGTQSRELRAVESYPIVVLGVLVLKCLQHFGVVILWDFALLAKSLQVIHHLNLLILNYELSL